MASYVSRIGAITGAGRQINRLSTVLGGDAAPAAVALAPETAPWVRMLSEYTRELAAQHDDKRNEVPDGWPAVGGAVVGGALWHGHRVLGVIGGASLARNVPALISSEHRRPALANLSQTGAAILCSLLMPGMPFVGFLIGYLGGGIAVHFTGLRKGA